MRQQGEAQIAWEGRISLEAKRQREHLHLAGQLATFSREASQPLPTTGATAGGDKERLRGIPAVGGVSGTMRGTQPEWALVAREARGLVTLIRHDFDGTSPGTQPELAFFGDAA